MMAHLLVIQMKIKTKLLRQIHIYCSLISCTLMLVFALTGISLNHRDLFEAPPQQTQQQIAIPKIDAIALITELSTQDISLSLAQADELIEQGLLSLPSPGKRLDLYIEEGELLIERTNFGLISQLNELHQSRYTSKLWRLVSDVTGAIFIFIALTGIWLSLRDKKKALRYSLFLLLSLLSLVFLLE